MKYGIKAKPHGCAILPNERTTRDVMGAKILVRPLGKSAHPCGFAWLRHQMETFGALPG